MGKHHETASPTQHETSFTATICHGHLCERHISPGQRAGAGVCPVTQPRAQAGALPLRSARASEQTHPIALGNLLGPSLHPNARGMATMSLRRGPCTDPERNLRGRSGVTHAPLISSGGEQHHCRTGGPGSASVQSHSSLRRPQRRWAIAERTSASCAHDARAHRREGSPRRSSSTSRGRFLRRQIAGRVPYPTLATTGSVPQQLLCNHIRCPGPLRTHDQVH